MGKTRLAGGSRARWYGCHGHAYSRNSEPRILPSGVPVPRSPSQRSADHSRFRESVASLPACRMNSSFISKPMRSYDVTTRAQSPRLRATPTPQSCIKVEQLAGTLSLPLRRVSRSGMSPCSEAAPAGTPKLSQPTSKHFPLRARALAASAAALATHICQLGPAPDP